MKNVGVKADATPLAGEQPPRSGARLSARQGTVLAFDFGTRRIGVAAGELELGLAHPLTVIHYDGKAKCFDAITALVTAWHPVLFVLGLPIHMNDEPHELASKVRHFAAQLQVRFKVPAVFVDERLSSIEAETRLERAGMRVKRDRSRVDAEAARLILETFFSSPSTQLHG